jgi:hypothetical protein
MLPYYLSHYSADILIEYSNYWAYSWWREKFLEEIEMVALVLSVCSLDEWFWWRAASSSLGLIGLRVYTCPNHISPHHLPYSPHLYFYPFYLISFFYSRELRRAVMELNMRPPFISNLLPLLRKIVLHWERLEDKKPRPWTIIPFWKVVCSLITRDLHSTKLYKETSNSWKVCFTELASTAMIMIYAMEIGWHTIVQPFVESEGSLSCSHQSAIWPYIQPNNRPRPEAL